MNARIGLVVLAVLAGCAPAASPSQREGAGGRVVPPAGVTHESVSRAALSSTPASTANDLSAPDNLLLPFRPSRHGFRFVNSFEGSPLPIDLPIDPAALARLSPGVVRVPQRYGLCGGMSFAAADLFMADRPPTLLDHPPRRPSAAYSYIYARQIESFAPGWSGALRFMEWMGLPDGGPDGARARTAAELPLLRSGLGAGRPVVLGLVLVSSRETLEPWHNHQVLAYGLQSLDGGGWSIPIYDPNFPGDDGCSIRVVSEPAAPAALRSELRPTNGRARIVRGFFVMPYEPMTPTDAICGGTSATEHEDAAWRMNPVRRERWKTEEQPTPQPPPSGRGGRP